jgi:hypothetical protein
MRRPLVSIVVCNHNYGDYVAQAVESALAQTYEDVEVIVIDDGSTDNSREVIAAFGDRVISIFQENQGQSGAFNTGFARSRGDIVMFLDSDDILHSSAAGELAKRWDVDIAKAQFCLATIDASGNFLGNIFPNYPLGLTSEAIREEALSTALYPCPPTSGNGYSRQFLNRVMPLYRSRTGADGPLNTVAPLYGRTLTIDRPLGFYRIHGMNDGAQSHLSVAKFRWFIEHDRRRCEFLRAHAEKLGIPLEADPLERAVLHLQYRIASLRLQPEFHPIKEDKLHALAASGIRASAAAPDRLASRICLAIWFVLVASAPLSVAHQLVASRFVPIDRPQRLSALLRRIKILRDSRDLPADLPRRGRLADGELTVPRGPAS